MSTRYSLVSPTSTGQRVSFATSKVNTQITERVPTKGGVVSKGKASSRAASGGDTKSVANAVYGYVQAVRALDRKTVTVGEIARSLCLPEGKVLEAATSLKSKGVKIAK